MAFPPKAKAKAKTPPPKGGKTKGTAPMPFSPGFKKGGMVKNKGC